MTPSKPTVERSELDKPEWLDEATSTLKKWGEQPEEGPLSKIVDDVVRNAKRESVGPKR